MMFYAFGIVVLLGCAWLFYRFHQFEQREDEFFRNLRHEPDRSPVRLYVIRDGRRVPYTERPGGPFDWDREDGL